MNAHKNALTDVRQQLIADHLCFADCMAAGAKHGFGTGVEPALLQAAAQEGLCEAALRFDEQRDVEFITYASYWIMKALHRCVRENYSLGLTGGKEGDGYTVDPTDGSTLERIDRADDADESLEYELRIELMREKMRLLTEAERMVLSLAAGMEASSMPMTEVARVMKICPATARSIYSNARVRLAELMENE